MFIKFQIPTPPVGGNMFPENKTSERDPSNLNALWLFKLSPICSLNVGVVVPIPTFPEEAIVIEGSDTELAFTIKSRDPPAVVALKELVLLPFISIIFPAIVVEPF